MDENKKVIVTGLVFILIVALGVVVYFLFIKGRGEPPVEVVKDELPAQVSLDESLKAREEATEFAQVGLDKSDELVRELARELSSHPKLARWLMSKDFIRNFTAAVDNIANGLSPRHQIGFFSLEEKFSILSRRGKYYIDPKSYHRYDSVADVFLSLNTEGSVNLYRQAKPLIQEAYRDLGYPEADFDNTLLKAIVELLKVPVVERDIQLEKRVASYHIADSQLESLSEAQKHLLRMGSENVRIIQDKLREMALGLGFSQDRLPRQQIYSP